MLPETSLEAYEQATPEMIQAHWEKILKSIKKLGLAIGEEIADDCGLDYHAVMRRMGELVTAGSIYKPGTKKNTKKNRKAFQYALVGSEIVLPPLPEKYVKGEKTGADHANYLIALTGKKLVQKEIFEADSR